MINSSKYAIYTIHKITPNFPSGDEPKKEKSIYIYKKLDKKKGISMTPKFPHLSYIIYYLIFNI